MYFIKTNVFKAILLSLIVTSCIKGGLKNENGVSFDADKLKGTYKMDLSPLIEESFSHSENNSDSKNLANGLASLAINSSVNVDLNFYGNNQGSLKMNTGWLGNLVGAKNENIPFEYELVDDSVLVINGKETNRLIIKKFSDSFDYIEFINKEKNQKVTFTKNL